MPISPLTVFILISFLFFQSQSPQGWQRSLGSSKFIRTSRIQQGNSKEGGILHISSCHPFSLLEKYLLNTNRANHIFPHEVKIANENVYQSHIMTEQWYLKVWYFKRNKLSLFIINGCNYVVKRYMNVLISSSCCLFTFNLYCKLDTVYSRTITEPLRGVIIKEYLFFRAVTP